MYFQVTPKQKNSIGRVRTYLFKMQLLAQRYRFKLLVHTIYVKDTSIKWSKINDQFERYAQVVPQCVELKGPFTPSASTSVDGRRRPSTSVDARRRTSTDVNARRRAWFGHACHFVWIVIRLRHVIKMASDDSDSDVSDILIFTYLHSYRRPLGQRRAIWIHDTIRKRRQLENIIVLWVNYDGTVFALKCTFVCHLLYSINY